MTDSNGALYVLITATRGSAPRDAGTAMRVTARATEGTIGGGALEHRAIAAARGILANGGEERSETIPLGPGLGQCCGGAVTLRYCYTPQPLDAPLPDPLLPRARTRRDLWLWGAGHVGRAMINAAAPGAFRITWVDTSREQFPTHVPPHVSILPAVNMPLLAARAPAGADHLIFTYSHDIDLALCAALLGRGGGSIGLIGSATKWARFSRRLRAMGLDPSGIACPIGDKALGKTPQAIAHGTVASLLGVPHAKVSA